MRNKKNKTPKPNNTMPSEFTWTDVDWEGVVDQIKNSTPDKFAAKWLMSQMNIVLNSKQAKIKEKERIELIHLTEASSNHYWWFTVNKENYSIPKTSLNEIKQAIESILNNEQPKEEPHPFLKQDAINQLLSEQQKEETNPPTFSYKDIPLSGELITKEECERQKREAFEAARKIDEKYFLEMLRKDSYYPSEISTQHLQYKTFEDYQQSLKK